MSLRIRRGLAVNRVTIIPEEGEFLYDTDTMLVYIGDGVTLGGNPVDSGGAAVLTVSGTANRITSTGGANPIIDIAATYVGQSSITTLGTIGTGTWQGTIIGPTYGGTGINNAARTITINTTSGIFDFSGAFTLTVAGNASISGTHSGTSSGTNTGDQTLTPTQIAFGSGGNAVTSSADLTWDDVGKVLTANGKLTVTGAIDPTHLYLDEQGGDPSNVANKGILYTKDVGALTQLFYMDSAGTVKNLSATGTGTVTSVSGTANRITSTGGTTPVIDIAATYVGQSSITTLGTIGTGIWQGTVLSPAFGGTGQNNGARTLTISTSGGTLNFNVSAPTLTIAGTASIIGTNTGDQTIASLSPLTTKGDLFTFSTVNTRLGVGTDTFVLTADSTAATGLKWAAPTTGTVTSVSGTTNRITSTGGTTPVIDISATFEALLGKVASPLSQFASTTSLQLLGVISDETGTGSLVFANTPTLVTPVLGVATATSINKVAITAPATGSTLTIDDGFTLHATGNVTALSGSHTGASSGTNTGDQTIASLSPLTTKGDLFTFSTVNTRLGVGATDGQILQVSSGAATGLAWSTPTYPSASGTSGKLIRSDGTNNVYSNFTIPVSFATGEIIYATGTNVLTALAGAAPGNVLISGTTPSWGKVLISGGTQHISGVLPIANGGSNKTLTLVNGGVLWTDTDSFEITAAGTQNQVLISNGAAAPSWSDNPIGLLACSMAGGNTVPASTTSYSQFFFGNSIGTNELQRNFRMGQACTIKNFSVRTSTTQDASGALVITVRKNGAGTTITVTLAAGQVAGVFTDTTHSFTVAVGDLISVQYANAATAASAALIDISVWMYL